MMYGIVTPYLSGQSLFCFGVHLFPVYIYFGVYLFRSIRCFGVLMVSLGVSLWVS